MLSALSYSNLRCHRMVPITPMPRHTPKRTTPPRVPVVPVHPRRTRRNLLELCLAVFFALPACAGTRGGPVSYGTKVHFAKGSTLTFPDFELAYAGTRKVSGSSYPRPFVYHDFQVTGGGKSKTVSWSSGTGDIGPTVFEFGGKNFRLELSRSDKLGRLAENEVVVWKD